MSTININDIGAQFANCYLIYDRKSTDDADNQKNSLSYQRSRNTRHAKDKKLPLANLTIPGFCRNGVIDEAHSAFKEEDEFLLLSNGTVQYRILRKKFAFLVELLKTKKIKGVIFLCWDRASRNDHDNMIVKKLIRLGSDILFSDTEYDGGSSGETHMDIDGIFAKRHSQITSEKIREAYEELREEGRCLYNSPIGYLDEGSDNKPLDPARAPIVKRIFERYATGLWSFRELAKWAIKQGLTKKPRRRMRTEDEIMENVELSTIEPKSRQVDGKTIEYILHNRFYIGEVKIGKKPSKDDKRGEDAYIYGPSTAHTPLIDLTLWRTVHEVLRRRSKSVYYPDKDFYAYRTMIRCTCGRSFSPYIAKGITYYRSRCKDGCKNPDANLNEEQITEAIKKLMGKIAFTPEEAADIHTKAQKSLVKLAKARDKKLEDLHVRQRKILADLDYIAQNHIMLLRTELATPESIIADTNTFKAQLEVIDAQIAAQAESAPEMVKYVLRFSELVENAYLYFKAASPEEKRLLVAEVFSELVFEDRELVKSTARDGYEALLKRPVGSGAPFRIRT